MRKILVIFSIFFLLPKTSWPIEKILFPGCTPARQIKEYVFDCDRNIYFSQQSESCKAAFHHLIEREAQLLNRALTKKVNLLHATHKSQKLTIDNADASLLENDRRLEELIYAGLQVEAELNRYLRSLRWPVTWDKSEPYPAFQLAEAYFDDEACFGQNRKRIARSILEVQNMLSDLQKMKREGNRLDAAVVAHGEQLESLNEKVLFFKGQTSRKSGNWPTNKTQNAKSTITSRKDSQK